MKTYMPSATTVEKKWYVVDATDMTLGRLASNVANVLRRLRFLVRSLIRRCIGTTQIMLDITRSSHFAR